MRGYMRRYLERKPKQYVYPAIDPKDYEGDPVAYEREFQHEFERLNPGFRFLHGEPGARLTDIINEFMAQGVTPDLLPADLGHDEEDEVDPRTGHFRVDPYGDIRSEPMDMREAGLFKDLDVAVNNMPSSPPPVVEPVGESTEL